jgi:hypothetical protein
MPLGVGAVRLEEVKKAGIAPVAIRTLEKIGWRI